MEGVKLNRGTKKAVGGTEGVSVKLGKDSVG